MNCKSYLDLIPKERQEMLSKIIHAIQNSDVCFQAGQEIIGLAESNGVLDNVIINPQNNGTTIEKLEGQQPV